MKLLWALAALSFSLCFNHVSAVKKLEKLRWHSKGEVAKVRDKNYIKTTRKSLRQVLLKSVALKSCHELLLNSHTYIKTILFMESPQLLKQIIFKNCGTNYGLVAETFKVAIQYGLHLPVFQTQFHNNNKAVQNSILHLIKNSRNEKEFLQILKVLSFDWRTRSFLGKGLLHWVVYFDNVPLMTALLGELFSDNFYKVYESNCPVGSKLCLRPMAAGPYYIKYKAVDSLGKTFYHYVRSADMAKVLGTMLHKKWFLIKDKIGNTPFTELVNSGLYDVAESILSLSERIQIMEKGSWRDLRPFGCYDCTTIVIDRKDIHNSISSIFFELFGGKCIPRFDIDFYDEDSTDSGGPTREFLTLGLQQMFMDDSPYFEIVDVESNLYAPSQKRSPEEFFYIAGFIALAIYKDIPVGVEFIPMLYKAIYGLNDWNEELFAVQHPALARSLNTLLSSNNNDLASLQLYLDEEETVPVDITNVHEYCRQFMKKRLFDMHEERMTAVADGFNAILKGTIQEHLTPRELALILMGEPSITADEFLSNICVIGDSKNSRMFEYFKNVVSEFTSEQIFQLIKFINGRDRLPYGGMGKLEKKIQVQICHKSSNFFPYTYSCHSELILPIYESEEQLKEKLLLAISEENAYFHEL